MRAGRILFGGIGVLAVAVGCGSSNGGSVSGGSGGGGNGGGGGSAPNAPSNVDLTICASVRTDVVDTRIAALRQCETCCTQGQFSESSSFAGACVCANPLPNAGATVCAAQAAAADSCKSCCTSAAFRAASWVGGAQPSCTCELQANASSCASTVSDPNAADACDRCCIGLGYINYAYSSPPASCECR